MAATIKYSDTIPDPFSKTSVNYLELLKKNIEEIIVNQLDVTSLTHLISKEKLLSTNYAFSLSEMQTISEALGKEFATFFDEEKTKKILDDFYKNKLDSIQQHQGYTNEKQRFKNGFQYQFSISQEDKQLIQEIVYGLLLDEAKKKIKEETLQKKIKLF